MRCLKPRTSCGVRPAREQKAAGTRAAPPNRNPLAAIDRARTSIAGDERCPVSTAITGNGDHQLVCEQERLSAARVLHAPGIKTRGKGLGGPACRPGSRALHEPEHRLLQLGIHFICDGHHVEQHGAKIYRSKIVL